MIQMKFGHDFTPSLVYTWLNANPLRDTTIHWVDSCQLRLPVMSELYKGEQTS